MSIYNELLRNHPRLLKVLMDDFYVDRKGEIPLGKGPYYRMPIIHKHDGLISVIYARGFIEVRCNGSPDC